MKRRRSTHFLYKNNGVRSLHISVWQRNFLSRTFSVDDSFCDEDHCIGNYRMNAKASVFFSRSLRSQTLGLHCCSLSRASGKAQKRFRQRRLFNGSSKPGVLSSNSIFLRCCARSDSEYISNEDVNLEAEQVSLEESPDSANVLAEIDVDTEEEDFATAVTNSGADDLENESNPIHLADLMMSVQPEDELFSVEDIRSHLERTRLWHIQNKLFFPSVKISTHKVWDKIGNSLYALTERLSEQDVEELIKIAFTKEFTFPVKIVKALMRIAKVKLLEPKTDAQKSLLMTLCKTLRHERNILSSLVQVVYSKLATECNDWTAVEWICAIYGLSALRRPPPTELVKQLCNKVEDSLSHRSLDDQAVIQLLVCLPRLKFTSSSAFRKNLALRCLEIIKKNPPINDKNNASEDKRHWPYWNLVCRLVTCAAQNHISLEEEDKTFINEMILICLDYESYSNVAPLLIEYGRFGGEKHTEVATALIPKVLNDKGINSVYPVLRMIDMGLTADLLTDSILQQFLDKIGPLLRTSSLPSLAYLLLLLLKLDTFPSYSPDVVETLKRRYRFWSVDQLITIIAFCRKAKPRIFLENSYIDHTLSSKLNAEELETMNLPRIFELVNELTLVEYRDARIAKLLIEEMFRREHKRDLTQMASSLNKCVVIGRRDLMDDYLEKFGAKVQASISDLTVSGVGLALELFRYPKKDQSKKAVNALLGLIPKFLNKFTPADIVRLFRSFAFSGYPKDEIFGSLVHTVIEQPSSYISTGMSWILWSIASKPYYLSRENFDLLREPLTKELKTMQTSALGRYLFACSTHGFYFPEELDEIAERVSQSTVDKLGFRGTGVLAKLFSKFNHRNEKFLAWFHDNMDGSVVRRMNLASLADILHVFTGFGLRPKDEFLEALLNETAGQFHSLSQYEFSWVLFCMSTFQPSIPDEWLQSAIYRFETTFSSFQRHPLCQILYCLVELGYLPSRDILIKTNELVHEDLASINYSALSKYLAACGKLGYKPVSLVADLEENLIREADAVNYKNISSLTWGLSLCEMDNEDTLKALAWSSYGRMNEMNAKQFSMFVWGLAKGNFRSKKFFAKAATIAAEKQATMNDKDLFITFWAFARVGQPAPEFFEAVYQRLPDVIQHLSPCELPSCAWALAKVNIYDEDVMKALDHAVNLNIDKMNVKGLAVLVYSFGKQNYNPSCLDAIWKQLEASEEINSFGWVPTGHLLWGAFLLNRKPEEKVLHAIEKLITEKSPIAWEGGQPALLDDSNFKPEYLVVALYCLYGLEFEGTSVANICAKRINEVDVLESLDSQSCALLAQCLLMSQFKHLKTPLQSIPPDYKGKIMNKWKIQNSKRKNKTQSARFQRVVSILQELGIQHETSIELNNKQLIVDVLLQNSNSNSAQQLTAISVVDDAEVIKNTKEPNGRHLMQRKLYQSAGLDVISVLDSNIDLSEWLVDQLLERAFTVDRSRLHEPPPTATNAKEDPDEFLEWLDQYEGDFIT